MTVFSEHPDVAVVSEFAGRLRVGNNVSPDTTIGPVVSQGARPVPSYAHTE
jgi:hypothetical protein